MASLGPPSELKSCAAARLPGAAANRSKLVARSSCTSRAAGDAAVAQRGITAERPGRTGIAGGWLPAAAAWPICLGQAAGYGYFSFSIVQIR